MRDRSNRPLARIGGEHPPAAPDPKQVVTGKKRKEIVAHYYGRPLRDVEFKTVNEVRAELGMPPLSHSEYVEECFLDKVRHDLRTTRRTFISDLAMLQLSQEKIAVLEGMMKSSVVEAVRQYHDGTCGWHVVWSGVEP